MNRRTVVPGPCMKIVAPLMMIALIAVLIACFWGIDWRWLPTSVGIAFALIVIANVADGVIQRRRDRRAEAAFKARFRSDLAAHPLFSPKDPGA